MSTIPILYCLLAALGATAPSAAPPAERAIEIIIAGPKEGRDRMAAAIQPLLGEEPAVRWVSAEQIPAERAFPEPAEQRTSSEWQILIDVSNPARLRVYLPAAEPKGTTIIRTLKREDAVGEGADLLTAEAAGQVVKAAVLTLRRHAVSTPELGAESATSSATNSPDDKAPRPQQGLFFRLQTGYGYLRTSESKDRGTFEQAAPVLGAAVGATLANKLILCGELRATWMGSANQGIWPGFSLVTLGPGATYYFDPDVYLSATIGLARMSYFHTAQSSHIPDPDLGYSGGFTVGWEWRASHRWGLGIAGQYNLALFTNYSPFDSSETRIYVTSVSILLAATYN